MKIEVLRALKEEKARRNFFFFCQLMIPDFYISNRLHLVDLCGVLQRFYQNDLLNDAGEIVNKLMVNLPPRHGKSLTLQLFSMWIFGKNRNESIMTICYNENLSGRFSKAVRNSIEAERLDERFVYSDVFADRKIKKGDASFQLWSLEHSHFSYLGGSFGSTITGLGCSIGIIDDPVKNSKEAFNERLLEEHYSFYTDTFLSRVEEGGKQIINQTRWSDHDLCGKLLEAEPEKWYVVKYKAYDEESDQMLCPDLMSKESYDDKRSKMSEEIFLANYQQLTINKKGALYKTFQTYSKKPEGVSKVYIDTADTGTDYLCAIFYDDIDDCAFITEVIYTQQPQEITEPAVSKALIDQGTNEAIIESNNGGRAFGRNVERLVSDENYLSCSFTLFHQSNNKIARILSNYTDVQRKVYFPEDAAEKWPDFMNHLHKFQRSGLNKHDDCADSITGVVENINSSSFFVG